MLWFSQVSSEDNHSPSLGWLLGKRGVSVPGTEGTSAVLKEWSRDSWDPEIFSRDLQCHNSFYKSTKVQFAFISPKRSGILQGPCEAAPIGDWVHEQR